MHRVLLWLLLLLGEGAAMPCDDGNRLDGDGCAANGADMDAPTPPRALATEAFVEPGVAIELVAFAPALREVWVITGTRLVRVDALSLAPRAFYAKPFVGRVDAGVFAQDALWVLVGGRDVWRLVLGEEEEVDVPWMSGASNATTSALWVADAGLLLLLLVEAGVGSSVVDVPARRTQRIPLAEARPIVRAQLVPGARADTYAMRCAAADGASFAFAQVPVANATDPSTMLIVASQNWSAAQPLADAYDSQRPWHTRWGLADADVSAAAVYVPVAEQPGRWQGVGDPRLRFARPAPGYYDVLLPNPYDAAADGGPPTQVLRHPTTGALWLVRGGVIAEVSMRGAWNASAACAKGAWAPDPRGACWPCLGNGSSSSGVRECADGAQWDLRFAVVGARFGVNVSILDDLCPSFTEARGDARECVLRDVQDAPAALRLLAERVRNGSAFLMRPYFVISSSSASAGQVVWTTWLAVAGAALLLVLGLVVCVACCGSPQRQTYKRLRSHV